MAVGAFLPNFTAQTYLYISTYQTQGTSDYRLYWQDVITGTKTYVNANFNSSTGGTYQALKLYIIDGLLELARNNTLMVEFRDAGTTGTFSTWWEATPVLNKMVDDYTTELAASVIALYIGSAPEFICSSSMGVRKAGAPTTPTMTVGIKFSVQTIWYPPETYLVTQYLKIKEGTPNKIAGYDHVVKVLFNLSEYQGPATLITTRTGVAQTALKIFTDIRGGDFDIRTFDTGTNYNRLGVDATKSMRVAIYNAIRTGITSMGTFETVSAIISGVNASITARLGIFPHVTYTQPNIQKATYPAYQAWITITGQSNIGITAWNTSSNFVYIRGGRSNQTNPFMSDGSGGGISTLTPLSGDILLVFYLYDDQYYATDTITIPSYSLSYQNSMNQATMQPDTIVSQVLPITQGKRLQSEFSVTFSIRYMTQYAPLPDDPQPPPDPPVPTPTLPAKDDTVLRQDKAVEDTKRILSEQIGAHIPVQSYYQEMADGMLTRNNMTMYSEGDQSFLRQIKEGKKVESISDVLRFNKMIKKLKGPEWLKSATFQQTQNHLQQMKKEAIRLHAQEVAHEKGSLRFKQIPDSTIEFQNMLRREYGGEAEQDYPALLHSNAQATLKMWGADHAQELGIMFKNLQNNPNLAVSKENKIHFADAVPREFWPKWLQEEIDADPRHYTNFAKFGLPYTPFNATDDTYIWQGPSLVIGDTFFNYPSEKSTAVVIKKKEGYSLNTQLKFQAVNTVAAGAALALLPGIGIPLAGFLIGEAGFLGAQYIKFHGTDNFWKDFYDNGKKVVTSIDYNTGIYTLPLLGYAAYQYGPGAARYVQQGIANAGFIPTLRTGVGLTSMIISAYSTFKPMAESYFATADALQTFGIESSAMQKVILAKLDEKNKNRLLSKDEVTVHMKAVADVVQSVSGFTVISEQQIEQAMNRYGPELAYKVYVILQTLQNPQAKALSASLGIGLLGRAIGKQKQVSKIIDKSMLNMAGYLVNQVSGEDFFKTIPLSSEESQTKKEIDDFVQKLKKDIDVATYSSEIERKRAKRLIEYMAADTSEKGRQKFKKMFGEDPLTLTIGKIDQILNKMKNYGFNTIEDVVKQQKTQKVYVTTKKRENPTKEKEEVKEVYEQETPKKKKKVRPYMDQVADETPQKQTHREDLKRMIAFQREESGDIITENALLRFLRTIGEGIVGIPRYIADQPDLDGDHGRGETKGLIKYIYDAVLLTEAFLKRKPQLKYPRIEITNGNNTSNLETNTTKTENTTNINDMRYMDVLKKIKEGDNASFVAEHTNTTQDLFNINEVLKKATEIKGAELTANETNMFENAYYETKSNSTSFNTSQANETGGWGSTIKDWGSYLMQGIVDHKTEIATATIVTATAYIGKKAYDAYNRKRDDKYNEKSGENDINIETDNVIKETDANVKNMNPTKAMTLWALGIVGAHRNDGHTARALSDVTLADTHEGRDRIINALHKHFHAMTRLVNTESKIVQSSIIKSMSEYFKQGMKHGIQTQNTKTYLFFMILNALVAPESTKERQIQEEFLYFAKAGAVPVQEISTKPIFQYDAMHYMSRHPHLVQNYIERVVATQHRHQISVLGQYTADRSRFNYELPGPKLSIRPLPEYKIPIKRKQTEVKFRPEGIKKLNVLQQRDKSELDSNYQFDIKRRRI